jgi:hypothetical protein
VDRLGLQRAQMTQFVLADRWAGLQITGHGFLCNPDNYGRTDHVYCYCHI